MTVDELHGVLKDELKGLRNEMAGGFEALRQELRKEMKAEADGLRKDLRKDMKAETDGLRKELKAEGETTRRHFDVVAERIESHVKLVAEVNSHLATVLDNHETRLQKIEKRRLGS